MNNKIVETKLAEVSSMFDWGMTRIQDFTEAHWANFLGALAVLLIGLWAAGRVQKMLVKLGDKYDKLDVTLFFFLGSFARYVVIALTILTMLSQFGFETTSLIAMLGAAGLAVGLALQGTLSNVAAGLMILFFRPFRVGDFIQGGGESGTVKNINLFATELATSANVQVFIPNAAIWGKSIRNISGNSTRRLQFDLGISYDDDINKAFSVIEKVIVGCDKVHEKPKPVMGVIALADSSVNLRVRVWCKNDDYWKATFYLNKAFKEAFDKAGITIPYPTRTVYEHKGA